MKISFILATLNRQELAVRAVQSVLRQPYQDFEIIVIDQSDDDCGKYIEELDQRIKYIHSGQKGLSVSRNIGVNYASGEIVALMDDDAEYDCEAVTIAVEQLEKDHNLYLVSGVVVDPKFKNKYVKKKKSVVVNWNNFMDTCNSATMFIKKDFLKGHHFDEKLGAGCYLGSAEESDIVAQMLEQGRRCINCRNLIVYHQWGLRLEEIPVQKHRSYCRGFGAFCAKHSVLYKNDNIKKLYVKAMMKTWGGFLLSMIKNDTYRKMFYLTTISSRIEGYLLYRKELAN